MKSIIILSVLLLAGCATKQELFQQRMTDLEARCAAYGIDREDPRFPECMMVAENQLLMQEQSELARSIAIQNAANQFSNVINNRQALPY